MKSESHMDITCWGCLHNESVNWSMDTCWSAPYVVTKDPALGAMLCTLTFLAAK